MRRFASLAQAMHSVVSFPRSCPSRCLAEDDACVVRPLASEDD